MYEQYFMTDFWIDKLKFRSLQNKSFFCNYSHFLFSSFSSELHSPLVDAFGVNYLIYILNIHLTFKFNIQTDN